MTDTVMSPFRDRDFRRWFTAETLLTVSMSSQLAISLILIDVSHSLSLAGMLSSAVAAVELLGGLAGGALADSYSRKRIIRRCVLVSVASIITLITVLSAYFGGLIGAEYLVVDIVALVSMIVSASETLADPSMDAALKELISSEQYPRAVSAAHARTSLVSLVSQPVTGFLYGITPILPFVLRLVCDGGFLVLLRSIRASFDSTLPQEERPRMGALAMVASYREGLRHVFLDPVIRAVFLSAPLVNLMVFTGTSWVVFSLRSGGASPLTVGLVTSGFTVGSLIGAAIAPWITDRVGSGIVAILGLTWMGGAFLIMFAFADNRYTLFGSAVLCMIPSVSIGSGLFAHVFERTPSEIQGRTIGIFGLLDGAATVSSPTIAAFAVESGHSATLSITLAGIALLGILLLSATREVRQLPSLLQLD